MVRILFHELNIARISASSGVFSGDNLHVGWKSWKKVNEGCGDVSGAHGETKDCVFVLIDRDVVDTIQQKRNSR